MSDPAAPSFPAVSRSVTSPPPVLYFPLSLYSVSHLARSLATLDDEDRNRCRDSDGGVDPKALSERERQIRLVLPPSSVARDPTSLPTRSEIGASKQVPRVVHAIDFLPARSATPLLSTWPAGASAVVRSVARAERNRGDDS